MSLSIDVNSRFFRYWFRVMVSVSAVLLVVTFASYAMSGRGLLSRVLFHVGMGGENNLGAWWSGMLLLLGAVHAFDGYGDVDRSGRERRGWLVLAAILVLLSFDEVASLHEFIATSGGGTQSWLPFGVIGVAIFVYSITQLAMSGVGRRTLLAILVSFALLGTVVLQELFQVSRIWDNPVVYGARAFLEEGTEIAAMLILILATRANTRTLLNKRPRDVLAGAHVRMPLIISAAILIPVLTAATYVLPYPGGPADWLAACLYLLCALHVVRSLLVGEEPLSMRTWLILAFFVGASAMSNALPLAWDPAISGVPVSLRGLGVSCILLIANAVLSVNGRRTTVWFYPFALAALLASFWPESQLIWCAVPPSLALCIYTIESSQDRHKVADFSFWKPRRTITP